MAETKRRLFVKKKVTVPASQTLVVDTFEASKFKSLEYDIAIIQLTNLFEKTLKMSVGKGDSDTEEQVYAIRGKAINIEIETAINGSDYEFSLTNNEPEDVELSFIRQTL